MARTGINRTQVEIAKNNLLARGENPSIDAIRAELGNTGSKSTIHRYLKELDKQENSPKDIDAFLSEPIKVLINQLVATLRTETQQAMEQQQEAYEQQLSALTHKLVETEAQLQERDTVMSSTKEQLANTHESLHASQNSLAEQLQLNKQATQTEAKLTALLQEKQAHIDSLEEKHRHNRDALTHYRESVQQQREQDQRNYEQQHQQLHKEIRTLKEDIAIKQNEVTNLHATNAKLATERNNQQEAQHQQQKTIQSLEKANQEALRKLHTEEHQLAQFKQENKQLKDTAEKTQIDQQQLLDSYQVIESKLQRLTLEHAKLHAELDAKSAFVQQLLVLNRNEGGSRVISSQHDKNQEK